MYTNDIVKQIKIDNRNYLQFIKLNDLGVKHCFAMNDLNFSFKFQTNEENNNNFKMIANDFKFNYTKITRPIQNHSNNVKIITNENTGINPLHLDNIDALITNQNNIPLAITTADCIPIIIYDPQGKVIANIHSGWKGTLKEILLETVNIMINDFSCNKNNLLFFFGPSICQSCFEVDEDVKEMFVKKFHYLSNLNDIIKKGINKYYIDTILLNKTLLLNKNIPEANIFISNICTKCNHKHFHSYRSRTSNEFGLGITIVSL